MSVTDPADRRPTATPGSGRSGGRSRIGLQITLGALACIPLVTGLMDLLLGVGVLPGRPTADANIESNYRYFATFWLAAGLLIVWIIPRVERATWPLRALCATVFVGGLARLLAMAVHGQPHLLFQAATVLELTAPPVLVWWQSQQPRQ
ncbi:DUF4345 domain-containing protein [Pilimelia columellifera]|uniref:DUF4345 domain-containing protein n=1 Tax=Pilimelia columellifera subsp. columellifera TaxID=706583 RepID=A0ABN3NPY2_9ACTN